jgi:hypothetical protein
MPDFGSCSRPRASPRGNSTVFSKRKMKFFIEKFHITSFIEPGRDTFLVRSLTQNRQKNTSSRQPVGLTGQAFHGYHRSGSKTTVAQPETLEIRKISHFVFHGQNPPEKSQKLPLLDFVQKI